jgi:hypothetical protein
MDRGPLPAVPTPEAKGATLRFLKAAQVAAGGALILNVVLYGIFLLSINPTNVGYSVRVVFQSWALVSALLIAWGCPALTLWGAHGVLRSARADRWAEARRWLLPFIVLGFISWIVAGYYLLEARNLLNAWTLTAQRSPAVRSVP